MNIAFALMKAKVKTCHNLIKGALIGRSPKKSKESYFQHKTSAYFKRYIPIRKTLESSDRDRGFWKRSVSSEDRWKGRLFKTVQKKASYIVLSINVYVRFSVTDMQKHMKKYAFSIKTYQYAQVKAKLKRKCGREYFDLFSLRRKWILLKMR